MCRCVHINTSKHMLKLNRQQTVTDVLQHLHGPVQRNEQEEAGHPGSGAHVLGRLRGRVRVCEVVSVW
jgi:hypothetical protein